MIGQLCETIVRYFLRKKFVFWLSFSALVAFLFIGLSKLRINEDLYAIFPKGKEFQKFNELVQQNKLNKQVVFSIHSSGNEELDYEQLIQLKNKLDSTFSNELDEVVVERLVNEVELLKHFQKRAILDFDNQDYTTIAANLSTDSIDKKIRKSAELIKGPKAVFLSDLVAQDPLGIFFKELNGFNPNAKKGNFTVKNGIVYSKDEQSIFFFSSIKINQKDTKGLGRFAEKLEKFKQVELKSKNGFDYFGTFQIAVENAKQIKKDTTLTSIISIAAILLLLVFYYRSLVAPLYFILPGIFSILCGGGIIGYIHPEISAISLATSSVLLGIVLDYTFHFVTHLKHAGSVDKTVKEVAAPMLTGSFTTLAALGSLVFTSSVILQDFGLIALCTLSGSALFTLLFLPVFMAKTKFKVIEREPKVMKSRKGITRFAIFAIVGITAFFLLNNVHAKFNADINSLSFHSNELKQKERFYTGINPNSQKKIFVFASHANLDKAKETNDFIYAKFSNNKNQFGISEIVSLAPYLPSSNLVVEKGNKWMSFWKSHPDVKQKIETLAPKYGLNPEGFSPFFNLSQTSKIDFSEGQEFVNELGLDKFYATSSNQHVFLTAFTVEKNKLDVLKSKIPKNSNIYVLDISDLTSSMLNVVKNDFNYLFIFTSLLVFISMLVIYGRIELALFTFFPMVLGWIWISGMAGIFDITFNFVNILVATFIFGLGDDYSIFTTDGLVQKLKTGVDSLKAYQAGIVLSGITTIIGTGALYFAVHPSIHSIGLISVVGIGVILLITLYLQPTVFNFFVSNRIRKKRGPITFLYFIYSIALFSYFFIGSMLINLILLFLILPLPLAKYKKRSALNFLVSKLAKSTLYAGIHVKKKIVDKHKFDFSSPSILIANHTSFLDILVVLMLYPKTVIFVKKWVYNSPVFGFFIRYGGYLFAENGSEGNLSILKERIAEGYSVVIFPEGTRSVDGQIHRFHKGAFFLSQTLNIPIQPVLILGTHEVNAKNDFIINEGQIIIKPLNRLYALPDETYKDYAKRACSLMRSEMQLFRDEYAGTAFYRRKIMENYLFKGPVVEWYVRVKWMLEHKNFDHYNKLIGKRKSIVDVGCGYGYLSLFLHYHNPDRTILGLDYDADKIALADNCMKLSHSIRFFSTDLRMHNFSSTDVYFFNDVLHYLTEEEQFDVLEKAYSTLNDGGLLIIREGIVELSAKHKNTKRTEELSTKWFKFNKTTNELCFLSSEKLKSFAEKKNLSFELTKHSSNTSNVLMVLRKHE